MFFFAFLRFSSFFFVFLRFSPILLRFSSLFFAFLRFSSFFFVFLLFSWDKGKRLQFTGKMGNFTPTRSELPESSRSGTRARTIMFLGLQGYYSQHQQNYLNNPFQGEVGKNLPKQFPESPPVGEQVGNSALCYTAKTFKARNYLKQFEGGSMSGIYAVQTVHKSLDSWSPGRETGPSQECHQPTRSMFVSLLLFCRIAVRSDTSPTCPKESLGVV